MDKTSPQLFTKATIGKAIPEIKIDICKTAENLSPYMQYSLSNVLLSKYNVLAMKDVANNCPIEWLSLNFTQLESRYTPYDEQNQPNTPLSSSHKVSSIQRRSNCNDLCLLVPLAPSGANIDHNIGIVLAKMRQVRQAQESPSSFGMQTISSSSQYAATLIWFYNQVNNNGPWDYKRQGKRLPNGGLPYEDFGNFNYGATARALGLSREYILCMGGWAAYRHMKPEKKIKANGNPGLVCLPHTGQKPGYGDNANDTLQIKAGIEYFDKVYGKVLGYKI